MEIAQGDIALMIQAAGNHGTVTEHTNLIPQTIAEYLVTPINGRQIRPVEFVAIFQIDPVTKAGAFPLLNPGLGEMLLHGRKNLFVSFLGPAMIPQPEDRQHLAFRCITKREAAMKIFLKGNGKVVGFKGM